MAEKDPAKILGVRSGCTNDQVVKAAMEFKNSGIDDGYSSFVLPCHNETPKKMFPPDLLCRFPGLGCLLPCPFFERAEKAASRAADFEQQWRSNQGKARRILRQRSPKRISRRNIVAKRLIFCNSRSGGR